MIAISASLLSLAASKFSGWADDVAVESTRLVGMYSDNSHHFIWVENPIQKSPILGCVPFSTDNYFDQPFNEFSQPLAFSNLAKLTPLVILRAAIFGNSSGSRIGKSEPKMGAGH